MKTGPFVWPHGLHSKERRYAEDGKTLFVTPFDADCARCIEALTATAQEAAPLVRDIAIAMRREGRAFCTTAEVRRILGWVRRHFPWHIRFWAEGAERRYSLSRSEYRHLLKAALVALEDAAVQRAGMAGR
jgi:hypothetical protein